MNEVSHPNSAQQFASNSSLMTIEYLRFNQYQYNQNLRTLYNLMFSSPRFLAYINKPSVYYLRRGIGEQQKVQILKQISETYTTQIVTRSNPVYRQANQLMKAQYVNQTLKYQNSFFWSPKFTPTIFISIFLIPTIFVTALMLYIEYISIPRNLMEKKIKYGIRFPELEERGYLDGWYEQYFKKDKVLQFEAYSIEDMQRLHSQGLLVKTQRQTMEKIEKKKAKFMRGDRNFISNEFKTT